MQINKKPGIDIISLDFLKKWSSVLKNAERQLIQSLLSEAKVVSKAIQNKFERTLREMFSENFKARRNKVEQQREALVVAQANSRHKKWLNN